jgi:hypothetical protein
VQAVEIEYVRTLRHQIWMRGEDRASRPTKF